MPIGERTPAALRVRRTLGLAAGSSSGQRGVTYLLLLFGIAVIGATLAAAGTAWSTAAQRGAEAELLFRGTSIQRALVAYARATPEGSPRLPATLAELLEDKRGLVPRHHLRQLYTDPFTGRADWVALMEGGRIRGVHSRSTRPALRSVIGPSGGVARDVSDWVFAAPLDAVAMAPVPAPSAASSATAAAASGPASEPGP